MEIHQSVTLERVTDAVAADDTIGFCVYCGAETDGVEPDASKYSCDSCGKKGVYGAEQLLLIMAP